MIVNIPSKLNIAQSLSFIDSIFSLPCDDEYIFDFRNLRWFEPFGLLAISYELYRFASKNVAGDGSLSYFNFDTALRLIGETTVSCHNKKKGGDKITTNFYFFS